MVATEAQKRAMKKYQRKMMSNPEYRERKNNEIKVILKKRYQEDETFRKNMIEQKYLKYYYEDGGDKALKAIRRLF